MSRCGRVLLSDLSMFWREMCARCGRAFASSNSAAFFLRRTQAKNGISGSSSLGSTESTAHWHSGARPNSISSILKGSIEAVGIGTFVSPVRTARSFIGADIFCRRRQKIGFVGQLAAAERPAVGGSLRRFSCRARYRPDLIATGRAHLPRDRKISLGHARHRDDRAGKFKSRRNFLDDWARVNRSSRASSCSMFSAGKKNKIWRGKKVAGIYVDISRQNSHTDERRNHRGPREDSRAVAAGIGRGTTGIVL